MYVLKINQHSAQYQNTSQYNNQLVVGENIKVYFVSKSSLPGVASRLARLSDDYPTHRDAALNAALSFEYLGQPDQANDYWQRFFVADPTAPLSSRARPKPALAL
ncbi:MAG: hypothetical protein COU69_02595 [Candidatus Pacebacteria bacterium CG10_big_fil_rev_8_21_14_0_10_56_10]|nr:MAG: hypothetical protein COU69_02595 [Candidatus Pacebacteria bacterium CG10_big_fil_rev_8_21_14_0_10_56_10]